MSPSPTFSRLRRCVLAGTIAAFGAVASARAQLDEMWRIFDTGHASNAATVGDLDGDGVRDVVLVSPYADRNGVFASGYVRAIDGTTGATLYDVEGTKVQQSLGSALEPLGDDVNGDGVEDYLVGDGLSWSFTPQVFRVFSGADGSVLTTIPRAPAVVHSISDFDGDGLRDVVVGSDFFSGDVRVFSSATGSQLKSVAGSSGSFGVGMAVLGDVDHDGYDEIAVGDTQDPQYDSGKVHVYSLRKPGKKPKLLATLNGAHNSGFGVWNGVVALSDLNGDGVGEFLVGAPGERISGERVGVVHAFDGATLVEIGRVVGAERETLWLGLPSGDFDHDGFVDFSCSDLGEPVVSGGDGAAQLWIHSGRTFAPIAEISDELKSSDGYYSQALHPGADFDGDGFEEVVAVAPDWTRPGGGYAKGSVAAYHSGLCFLSCVPETLVVSHFGNAPASGSNGASTGSTGSSGYVPDHVDTSKNVAMVHASGFAPQSSVAVVVSRDNGVATWTPILSLVADANGTARAPFPLQPLDDHDYEMEAVGVDAFGNVLTTPTEQLRIVHQ